MEKLLFIPLVVILGACATNSYDKEKQKYAKIFNADDPNIRLQLLEERQQIVCKHKYNKYDCPKVLLQIAGVSAIQLKQYTKAVQAADKSFTLSAPRDFYERCNSTWNIDFTYWARSSSNNEKMRQKLKQQGLDKTFAMVYYQALKGANDPKAKDQLNLAYTCELYIGDADKNLVLDNYIQESQNMLDTKQQAYVKIFINKIYKPIHRSQSKINSYNLEDKQINAHKFVLYSNALTQAKKMNLPQVYQDYLTTNINLHKSLGGGK